MGYIKQLDGIRAIAVLLVIIHHWTPLRLPLHHYTSIFNGVDIFFVLSGFLITSILLHNRNEADDLQLLKSTIVKNFFIRRILRIFPIYYLLLFGLFLFANTTGTSIKEDFIYYITYTANTNFFNKQGWDGMLSHLWSLSVEEQFYLFWPWLMLFPRKSWLLPIILFSFFIGILTQYFIPHGYLLTFACLDCFGMGAFLAWVVIYKPQLCVRLKMLWAVLALAAAVFQLMRISGNSVPLPSRTATAFITIWVISNTVKEQKRFLLLELILNNRVLVFIGKISYGIYLYHLIIPYYTYNYLHNLNQHLPTFLSKYNIYLIRLENFCLVILLAYLSWKFIEQPVLTLKKHFEYKKPIVLQTESDIPAGNLNTHGKEIKTLEEKKNQKEFETI